MNKEDSVPILFVVVILGALIGFITIGGCKGCNGYYSQGGSGTYECIKLYVFTSGDSEHTRTSKRVDLRPENGGSIQTFVCDDDWRIGQFNSATLYAQLEPNKWYKVNYKGYRREGWIHWFPNITYVKEVELKVEQ